MKRASTPSFIATFGLRYEPWQRDKLDKLFQVDNNIYNALVKDCKKALGQLERTRAWRRNKAGIASIFAVMDKENPSKEHQEALKILYAEKQDMLSQYGLGEYAFQAKAQKYRKHYKKLVNTHIAQTTATAVWHKFEDYLFGNGEEIAYRSWQKNSSIEGKNNSNAITFHKGVLRVCGMKIPVEPPDNAYEQECLTRKVKYCRLVRIPWKTSDWLYQVQLVLEGDPPVKVDTQTGEMLHAMGKGRAGIDIGPQTVAFVSHDFVALEELANKASMRYRELRLIERAMDRSRRGMNPEFFNPDGTVIDADKLPPELLKPNGKRKWARSKHYNELARKKRYLNAKLARLRRCQHNEMANRYLAQGDEFYIEDMNFAAMAKKAKAQKKEDLKPGEKFRRRKRFGKSIANKAPAGFVATLERKVLRQGGSFQRINTREAKASQYDHLSQEYNKKKLSQRWHRFKDGRKIQRDLYSAFLIMNTNHTLNGFDQALCDANFEHFFALHNLEISRLRGVQMPSSAGVA